MSSLRSERIFFLGLALLLTASLVVAWRVGAFSSGGNRQAGSVLSEDVAAPQLKGLSRWFNSEPLTMNDLRGHVVLVDFWTYSCINCIRELPVLRTLYQTYHKDGLQILGIHTPEFGFEKVPTNVQRAIVERGVTWPVALDDNMQTWNAFDNHFWPHIYVIDKSGHIRFDRIGEGDAPEVEHAIRELLSIPKNEPEVANDYHLNNAITSELYLGYDRGESDEFIGNPSGYRKDEPFNYTLPSESIIRGAADKFFLFGSWTALHESVLSGPGGGIALPFTAADVYIVAGSDHAPIDFTLKLDGAPVPRELEGESDVGGVLRVAGRDLYHVLHLPDVQTHRLDLQALSAGASVYTFTFG
ncbi:MAG: redoxin domain-containing protein [Actinomycetota bacterium]